MASKLPSSTAGVDMNSLGQSFHTPPLDWREAMRAATARLNEGWELPETRCHSAVEEELAAFLCAYGMLGDEVDRMHAGGPPVGEPPLHERNRIRRE